MFSASMEETINTYDDGEILGSIIGTINLHSNKIVEIQVIENDSFVITKIESLTIIEKLDNEYKIVSSSDNDNGTSEIYTFILKL